MDQEGGQGTRPIRVLMLNHNLREEGSFFRCWHLAKHLASSGISVHLVTVSRSRRTIPRTEIQDGVTLIETPNLLDLVYGLGSGWGALGIPYRMYIAGRGRFDLVHAFEHKPNVLLPALLHRWLRGVPLVVDWADWWGFSEDGSGLQERKPWPVPRLETTMEEFVHVNADWVTTISTGLEKRAYSLGIPKERVRRIPSGAPCDEIRPQDLETSRKRLSIRNSVFLLGYVGSDIADLEMTVPALRRLSKTEPNVKLATIGPFSSALQGTHPDLRDSIASFGRVPFAALPEYLGACDAFLLPLRDTVFNRTRWPNKFGDYVAAGRPVLCSNVGDVADIVRTEKCGLVWDDLSDLIAGVERLKEDKSLAAEMGGRARAVAEGQLSWSFIAPRFADVYRAALTGQAS